MPAEDGEVLDLYYSTHPHLVFFVDVSQEGYLNKGLLHQLRCLLDYLQSQVLSVFVVKYLDDLSKGSFVDATRDFISIGDMISNFILIKITKYSPYLTLQGGWSYRLKNQVFSQKAADCKKVFHLNPQVVIY